MLYIAGSLFGAWVLTWFGFDHVVAQGMSEVFGKEISKTGYYFLFGFKGALSAILSHVNPAKVLKFNKNNDN